MESTYVCVEGRKVPSVHAVLEGHLWLRNLTREDGINANGHGSHRHGEEGRGRVEREVDFVQQQLERLEVVPSVLVSYDIGSEGNA